MCSCSRSPTTMMFALGMVWMGWISCLLSWAMYWQAEGELVW